MFAFIRRHQALGLFFIVLVCISFVVLFTPNAKLGIGVGGGTDYGSIDGVPISRGQFIDAYHEAYLSYLFRYGQWPDQDRQAAKRMGFDTQKEALNRLFLDRKLKELGVQVGDAAVADWITTSGLFQDRKTGIFDRRAYDHFVNNQLSQKGLKPSDFHRFVRHEIGIRQLIELEGLSGDLIPPNAVKALFKEQHEQAQTQIAFLSASNFLAEVKVTPKAISQFYTNRMSLYRIPDRIQVDYVEFPVAKYKAAAAKAIAARTNLTAEIDQIYAQQGTNTFTGPDGKVLPPAKAKAQIKAKVLQQQTLYETRKAANAFAEKLFDMEPAVAGNLAKQAAAQGLQVKTTGPFEQFGYPPNLKVNRPFVQAAFKLNKQNPFSMPLIEPNSDEPQAVYLLAFNKRLPSKVPPLKKIQARVTLDYRDNQARELAREAGEHLYQTVTNGLASGKKWEELCAHSKAQQLQPPPFSRADSSLPGWNHDIPLRQLQEAAFDLKPGGVSKFVQTRDGGFILRLQKLIPVDQKTIEEQLASFTDEQRRQRQYQAFNEWYRHAQKAARIIGPGGAESDQAAAN